MVLSSDDEMRSNRRPVSRNNEHDYSAWKIDEYDMDLSEYLIEGSSQPEDLLVEAQPSVKVEKPFEPYFDETQNFEISAKKKARKSYACPICGKLWVTPSKLKRHLGSHKNFMETPVEEPPSEQMQCPICTLIVDSPQKLTEHMAEAHLNPKIKQEEPLAEKIGSKYVCTICDIELCSPAKLQRHMKANHMKPKISTSEKPRHVCYICEKVAVTPSKLERHLRSHLNFGKLVLKSKKRTNRPRRHECIHCGKCFEVPSKLLRHVTAVHREFNKNLSSSETKLEISTVTSILGD